MKFRTLRADEIECRVSTVNDKGVSLLLYKDARADMNLLDEEVGPENWQRSHELINGNLFCNVEILINGVWVKKQDVGTESNTQAEKGQASDSFKRACVNWGIGRELYTAPFIWVGADGCNLKENKGKVTTFDKFSVTHIAYDSSRNITELAIKNLSTGKQVFKFGMSKVPEKQPPTVQAKQEAKQEEAELKAKVLNYINKNNTPEQIAALFKYFKISGPSELTYDICMKYIAQLEKKGKSID